jgi:basic membrane protein A
MSPRPLLPLLLALLTLPAACKRESPTGAAGAPGQAPAAAASGASGGARPKVGVVTDVGGRGDGSFNDSALRGLELWAAGKVMEGGRYREATPEEVKASLPEALASRSPPVQPLAVEPLVLQSKVQEEYEPNLQLLVDQGVALAVGVGYMLEPAVETVARRNPDSRFLLIDSVLLDSAGKPVKLPNVRTTVFREEEGSFLVGALAGLVSKGGKVGFVGGTEVPLIKRFEAGFRAGVLATRPDATPLVAYTGTFDNVAAGKQVAQDLLSKGADVVFHAAGSDGLGVIQAVKEARAAGRQVWAIGVDSDQAHLAPDAILTSMVKRVDLAVYDAVRALTEGRFEAGDVALGLKEGGVDMAPVRVDFPGKAEALARVEALRQKVAGGAVKVPTTPAGLAGFKVAP